MKKVNYIYTVLFSVVWLLASCKQEPIVLNFTIGPDDTHSTETLVNQFNHEHEGDIHINWQVGNRSSNEQYESVVADLSSGNPTIDIFAGDVTWTASLGKNDLVADLSAPFYQSYSPSDFSSASMNSVVYQTKVLGMPWFTDVGMLYYRKDLLDKYGFDAPTTWNELTHIVHTIKEREKIPYGFVFQGENYEGGIVNACEFIWNAGGDVSMSNLSISGAFEDMYFDPSIITVDSKASELGFKQARQLVEQGISPDHIHTFREQEALYSFYYGGAIFMRGWPSAYGLFAKPGAKVGLDKIGITAIPTIKPNSPSFSCLGGWNLMMGKHLSKEEQAAALTFIKYMIDEPQQYYFTMNHGALPTLRHLYTDEQLLEEAPILEIGRNLLKHARNRPISPYYMEYAPEIATIFHRTIKGELLPELAVYELQKRLEEIQISNKIAFQ